MKPRLRSIRWIYTDDLPKGYDIADLLETGISKEDLLQWFRERVRTGPMPRYPKPRKNGKAGAPRVVKPKPKPPTPESIPAPESNVVPLKQTEEDLGVPPEYSEDSLAEAFSDKYKNSMIYVRAWGDWMEWRDARWQADETGVAFDCARKIAKAASTECLQRTDLGRRAAKIANNISSRRTISNIEAIAKTDRKHASVPSQFDADPWVLNTPDGVVELRTGAIRPARRDDYLSKTTKVGPGGKCDSWMRFLDVATDGDVELQEYMARVAGYCLTGSVAEHIFFFVYGTGGNGKGTFVNLLDWLLNSYSAVAQMETFTEQRFSKHAAEIAHLQGARMVTAQETEEGKRWNESRLKAMTGGDPITANFMHQNPFTFMPNFKLLFAGNHKPALRNIDEAIRRRMHLIPFTVKVQPKDRDPDLPDKLQAEADGILSWAIRGCLDWQDGGLAPPDRVLATTAEYFQDEDILQAFFDEHCLIQPGARCMTGELYARYQMWAKASGEYSLPRKRFIDQIRHKGFESVKRGGVMTIQGLDLKQLQQHWGNPPYPDD